MHTPPVSRLIENDLLLTDAIAKVQGAEWLALDTEFVRERTYYPQPCILQIAAPLMSFCIDLLAPIDLRRLSEFLQQSTATKIFHASRQDLEALARIGTSAVTRLFDTQIAASLAGHPDQVSYAWLVEHYCGVLLDKSQTRTDWSQRPLSAEQRQYVHADVAYLGELREILARELDALGRKDWLQEDCERISAALSNQGDPRDSWQRLRGIQGFSRVDAIRASKLAVWREKIAQQSDRPREWIIKEAVLLEIARTQPADIAALSRIPTIAPATVRRFGAELIELLRRDDIAPENFPEFNFRLSTDGQRLLKDLTELVKVRAQALQLQPGVLATRKDLEALIMEQETRLIRGWRSDIIGNALRERVLGIPFTARVSRHN